MQVDIVLSDKISGSLKTRAVRSAFINIVAQFVILICQTVGVVILTRLLTPRDFGLVAMVTAFSVWLMNFGINGFTEYIIQKEDIDKQEINAIFWLHAILATFFFFAFILFGQLLVHFYSEPTLGGIATAMATSIIFQSLATAPLALLKREMRFPSLAACDFVAVVLSIVLALSAAFSGLAYWAIVIRQLTIPAVSLVFAWILCPWRPGIPSSLAMAIPGLRYTFQVYCNFSLEYLTRSIDKVLLGRFYGPVALGNYDRAYFLSSMPVSQLLSPLHGIALATLSRLRHDQCRFSEGYTNALESICLFGFLATLTLTFSAQDFVLLVLGPEWVESGLIIMAFGPGIAAMLLYGTRSWLHLSLGTPDRWLRWNIISSLLTATAFILVAPLGPIAIAIAYSGMAYVLLVPALWYAGRPIQLRLSTLLGSFWPYFASAITVCISWFSLLHYSRLFSQFLIQIGPIARIAIVSSIASLLYLAFIIIYQRSLKSIRKIRSLVTLILSREKV